MNFYCCTSCSGGWVQVPFTPFTPEELSQWNSLASTFSKQQKTDEVTCNAANYEELKDAIEVKEPNTARQSRSHPASVNMN